MSEVGAEGLRSRVYALLARLLAAPPDGALLASLRRIEADGSGDGMMAAAWARLAAAARGAEPAAVDDEYHALFIGLGRGELMPYASWYRAGSLNDWPLAALRADLGALGIERRDEVKEPEDHISAVLQSMALLAEPAAGDGDGERRFFASHVAPWVRRFFEDLRAAKGAEFFRAVGELGLAFLDLDERYLESLASAAGAATCDEESSHERA